LAGKGHAPCGANKIEYDACHPLDGDGDDDDYSYVGSGILFTAPAARHYEKK
jgi:hypothetical protein